MRKKSPRTSNPSEIAVVQHFENEGYQMLKRGWPDFIAVKGSEARFIEVKRPPNPQLKPEQKRVAEILKRFGIEVEIWVK